MTDSIIPFAACHRGSGMHADVNIDYDGARISEMAKYIASISNSGIEFERIARITNGGNAKSIDAFYYDDVEEVVHIIEFKSGKEYSSHKAQMAMYVYAIQREFNAVRDGIQIRTHVKYFDNPQHDVVVDIQMESRSITEEFSSRNPKMFAEMFNVVANKEASKARNQERYQTEEYKAAIKEIAKAYRNSEHGKATIKAQRESDAGRSVYSAWAATDAGKASIKKSADKQKFGTDKRISSKAISHNKQAQIKKDIRAGKPVPVKAKRVYKNPEIIARKAEEKRIIENMKPPVFY